MNHFPEDNFFFCASFSSQILCGHKFDLPSAYRRIWSTQLLF